MIGLIVVVVIIIIVFNIFLFSGAKKEIMDEKGVDSWKDVTGELDKSNLKDIDASLYILYCIANWTPMADLEDLSYLEMKNALPSSFITEYFDIDSNNYQQKTKHVTDKIVSMDEYDLDTKRSNIIKSAKFLKNKDFQFKRDLASVCGMIINRRPLENIEQGPPKGELEVFNEMAKILDIKTESIHGFIKVEGEFKE